MVQCPECGEEYSPQGLYGHLRMQHGLSGADLQQTYEDSLKGNLFEGESEADALTEEEGEPVGDGAPAAESEEPVDTAEEEEAVTFEPGLGEVEEEPDPSSERRPQKESHERDQREPMRTEFEERGHVARAAERLRRARTRRRVVEDAMETKQEVVEEHDFFEDETEEVPANPTWSDLLEACAEEETRALEGLKDAVFHAEGRPKE